MAAPVPGQPNETVVINPGEVVRFPVPSGHPLARYQQLKPVSEFGNLHDLAIVRKLITDHPQITPDEIVRAVTGLLSSFATTTFLSLLFPDITVKSGGILILSGPINYVTAGKVVVQGEIQVHGSLNLFCSQLGG